MPNMGRALPASPHLIFREGPGMVQRKQDMIFGFVGIGVSLFAMWQSYQYPTDSALFPILSAAGIFICSLMLLIISRKNENSSGNEKVEGINIKSALTFGLIILLYVFSIEKMGFFSSSFLFVLVISMLWGGFGKGVSIRFSLIFAVLFTILLYVTFVKIFTVPLPKGFLL